jgi:hypothetical protein
MRSPPSLADTEQQKEFAAERKMDAGPIPTDAWQN